MLTAMTHDARLPTVEQIMDGFNRDQRELVDTPLGKMERWCAETIFVGTTKGMLSVYDMVRSDATTQASLANELELLRQNLARICAAFADFSDHVSQFV